MGKSYGYGRKRTLGLHQKIAGTVGLLLCYRLLSHVPLPFVDNTYVKALVSGNGSLNLLNLLTGGNLGNMSVMALGITPYITASIVMQLVGVVVPGVAMMQKEGSTGRKKFQRISLCLAVVLALCESIGMMAGYGRQGILVRNTWYAVLVPSLVMVGGVFLLSYMGQFIEDHLFGNGVSLILATGILCSYVEDGYVLGVALASGKPVPAGVASCLLAVLLVVCLFLFATWLSSCYKEIPVVYSGKAAGGGMKQRGGIPLKLIGGSVVPIIFASSIITLPSLIQSFTGTDLEWLHMFNTSYWLKPDEPFASCGLALYLVLIVWFNYYYQALNLNEQEMALQLKQRGGVVPGIRPGLPTEEYLYHQMRWLTFLGGICLCVVAVIPMVLSSTFHVSNLSFFGTSIIITVSVLDDTIQRYVSDAQVGRYRRLGRYGKGRTGSLFGRRKRGAW